MEVGEDRSGRVGWYTERVEGIEKRKRRRAEAGLSMLLRGSISQQVRYVSRGSRARSGNAVCAMGSASSLPLPLHSGLTGSYLKSRFG